jgi:hypothetical protein
MSMKRLEKYRGFYDQFKDLQIVRHFGIDERKDILSIIREEIDPKYNADLFCGSCVCDMLVFAFEQMELKYPKKVKNERKTKSNS